MDKFSFLHRLKKKTGKRKKDVQKLVPHFELLSALKMTSQGMFVTKYIVTNRIEQNWIQKHLLYILV